MAISRCANALVADWPCEWANSNGPCVTAFRGALRPFRADPFRAAKARPCATTNRGTGRRVP